MSEFLIKAPEKKKPKEEVLDKLDEIHPTTPSKPQSSRVLRIPRKTPPITSQPNRSLDKAFEAANKEKIKAQKERMNLLEKYKDELRDLIECLGYGHKRFMDFPQYNISNSSQLKSRINSLVDKISNPAFYKILNQN